MMMRAARGALATARKPANTPGATGVRRQNKACQAILTGARHDSGLVQNAPRRRSRLGGAGGFAAVAPIRPRSEISRPLVPSRFNI
jgi:hypothetical protein